MMLRCGGMELREILAVRASAQPHGFPLTTFFNRFLLSSRVQNVHRNIKVKSGNPA